MRSSPNGACGDVRMEKEIAQEILLKSTGFRGTGVVAPKTIDQLAPLIGAGIR